MARHFNLPNHSKTNQSPAKEHIESTIRAAHSGGSRGGAVAPAKKTKFFFSKIVFEFVGLFLVAILVRNLKKTG